MQKNSNDLKIVSNEYIIESSMLSKVLEDQAEAKHKYDPIGEEPVIKEYFNDELLKICGKMGLAGAPPYLVSGVHSDVRRVVQALVGTIQKAHRALWDGVLPEDAGLEVVPTKPQDEPPSQVREP